MPQNIPQINSESYFPESSGKKKKRAFFSPNSIERESLNPK